MKAACPRLFEVEALRDGRLTGAELVRFQSHLAACSVCARESRALQALAEALRTPTNVDDADELQVRRERTRLLAAFDASLVPAPRGFAQRHGPFYRQPGRSAGWVRSAGAVALLSLLTALAFVLRPARPPASSPPGAALASVTEPVTIRADGGAQWSRQVDDGLEKIVLESGALSIRVDHAASQRRLLVILPDGELEDIGTVFSVSADAGHTTRVTVQDGSVVLRLSGRPALALGAGDSWTPPSSSAVTLRSAPAPARAHRSVKAAPSRIPPPRRSTADPDPSADFRAALSAFNGGDNSGAAQAFAAFLSQYPRDARAEDAAYLRILALQRAGNSPAAQQAAHDYLSRYPRGFRHAEVDALLR